MATVPTSISIPADAMQAIVQKAIFEGISAEQRELLVQQAIEYLVAPPTNGYGQRGTSPLESAFQNAVAIAANQIVRELVKESEFTARITEMVEKTLREFVAQDVRMVEAVGSAVGTAVTEVIRDRGAY